MLVADFQQPFVDLWLLPAIRGCGRGGRGGMGVCYISCKHIAVQCYLMSSLHNVMYVKTNLLEGTIHEAY